MLSLWGLLETDYIMNNSKKVNKVGILGAGHIARKMATTLREMNDVEAYAVAARQIERAQTFAAEFGIQRAYGSYEELVRDENIDLIYIATPNSSHYNHAKLCLEQGRPVLCEKPFTVNVEEAKALIELSQKNKLFITEAIWTRYMPFSKQIKDVAWSGILGNPMTLTASLSYPVAGKERIVSPALGGGALLDLGVYALNFAAMIFGGDIERVVSACTKMPSGVDGQNSITLCYAGGRMAVLQTNVYCAGDRQGIICGDKGYMIVDNINNPQHANIYAENHTLLQELECPQQITGFEYQVQASLEAISQGKIESADMPHAEIIRMMQLMDDIRKSWGVHFPADEMIF